MCQAVQRGSADTWYIKIDDPSPDKNVLGWMIYTQKWGSLVASAAGPNRISDFAAGIYYHEMPRALAYIDQLFETQQAPPPVEWAIRVVTDGDDPYPDKPGPVVLRRRKSPDEK
jgi:hypothetical protein